MNIQNAPKMQEGMNHLQLRFSTGGKAHVDTQWYATDVCSPYTRLYFVINGSGLLQYRDVRIEMKAGHLYLIPAGLCFSYGCPKEMDKLFFHVTLLQPDGYELLQGLDRILDGPFAVDRIKQMCTYYFGNSCLDAFLLENEVRQAMSQLLLQSGYQMPPVKQYSESVKRTIRYIQQHLSLQLTASSIAENLFLSESQLTRRFREEVGRTVSRYIDDLLFFSAQMQLAANDRSIGQISESLGFCDQFYFSRRFRQRYGVTPRQYRARLSAEPLSE